jgi:predicted small lipoprotein YifL
MAVLLASLVACGGRGPASTPAIAADSSHTLPNVLATIGDSKLTADDVRARYGGDLEKLETQ